MLDRAVLERVVGDHDDSSSGSKGANRLVEAPFEGFELFVDGDPDGLERVAEDQGWPWDLDSRVERRIEHAEQEESTAEVLSRVETAEPEKAIVVFHFSGHGSQLTDEEGGDEQGAEQEGA